MIFKRKKVNRVRPAAKKRRPGVSLPDWRPLIAPLRYVVALAVLAVIGVAVFHLLDTPVRNITLRAPFQRVTAVQIEDRVRTSIGGGILSSDLAAVRDALEGMTWIDDVRIRRQWPSTLVITVSEQVAAARWGEKGLLNTRGELFVSAARHVPAELPVLRGPDGSQWQVAQRYLALRGPLLEHGLQLTTVTLDQRGGWRLTLARGIEIRLGRQAVDRRIHRLIDVVTPLVAGRTDSVNYIDLRYANGFAIGWNTPAASADGESEAEA